MHEQTAHSQSNNNTILTNYLTELDYNFQVLKFEKYVS